MIAQNAPDHGETDSAAPGGAARRPDPDPYRHSAISYSTTATLLDTLTPLLLHALDRGELVWAAVDAVTAQAIHHRLGLAAGAILFADPGGTLSYSAQTTATRRAERLRAATATGRRALVLSDRGDRSGFVPDYWVQVDAGCNLALSDVPVTLICLYPQDDPAETTMRWNHPELLQGPISHTNPSYRPPQQVFADRPAAAAPLLGLPTQQLTFGTGGSTGLRGIRAAAARHGLHAGLDAAHTEALTIATSELVSNSIEHGPGHGTLSWWTQPGHVTAQIDDTDHPASTTPPGLRPPEPTGPRGRGVWLARQLTDTLHFWTDPHGTHVRIQIHR